jgi:hypothetical protein
MPPALFLPSITPSCSLHRKSAQRAEPRAAERMLAAGFSVASSLRNEREPRQASACAPAHKCRLTHPRPVHHGLAVRTPIGAPIHPDVAARPPAHARGAQARRVVHPTETSLRAAGVAPRRAATAGPLARPPPTASGRGASASPHGASARAPFPAASPARNAPSDSHCEREELLEVLPQTPPY